MANNDPSSIQSMLLTMVGLAHFIIIVAHLKGWGERRQAKQAMVAAQPWPEGFSPRGRAGAKHRRCKGGRI